MRNNLKSRHQEAPTQTLRERAAQSRDAAGRFLRRNPEQQDKPEAPQVRLPVPVTAHPDTYALRVDGSGLGLHAVPGATVMVEPVMPSKAGLAVFYMKGRAGPLIFDLTRNFRPEFAGPFAPGSEVMPLIEVVTPVSGQFGRIRADLVEKMHRVRGIYTPAEVLENYGPAPLKLPEMAECPDGMGEQYVESAAAYPTVRPGETVIYDPSQRGPTNGALCVLQWSRGRRDVLLTDRRTLGSEGEERWFIDPVNRPRNTDLLRRRLEQNDIGDVLYASDGPFTVDQLREKIVGTVVGVLARAPLI